MRGTARMTWVKLHVTGWLHGSIRYQLEPDERGVWADLIALAGQCLAKGKICDNEGVPYPKQYLANQLNISLELLDRTIVKCKQDGRIKDGDGVITIANWGAYQSEYERQKTYRQKAPMSDRQKVAMTRSLVNQHPDIAIDVLSRDFGHRVIDKEGEILGGSEILE